MNATVEQVRAELFKKSKFKENAHNFDLVTLTVGCFWARVGVRASAATAAARRRARVRARALAGRQHGGRMHTPRAANECAAAQWRTKKRRRERFTCLVPASMRERLLTRRGAQNERLVVEFVKLTDAHELLEKAYRAERSLKLIVLPKPGLLYAVDERARLRERLQSLARENMMTPRGVIAASSPHDEFDGTCVCCAARHRGSSL